MNVLFTIVVVALVLSLIMNGVLLFFFLGTVHMLGQERRRNLEIVNKMSIEVLAMKRKGEDLL